MIYFLLLCAILLVLIVCRSEYENRHFITKKYRLYHPAAKEPVTMVYLSDLHENSYGLGNEKLIEGIKKAQPDVILLGGDLIIGKGKRVETAVSIEFLKKIQDIAPVIYSFGNHETRVRERQAFTEYLAQVMKTDVIVLNNHKQSLDMKGVPVTIYGLELNEEVYEDASLFRMPEKVLFTNKEESHVKILLAHTPNLFEEYVKWNPDIVFSGHNHGGIVRLFGRGIISTEGRILPRYSYGVYQKKQTKLILSSGAGAHTIKFRLFNSPEIVVLELHNKLDEK